MTTTRRTATTEIATYIKILTMLGYSFSLNECGDIVESNGKRLEDIELSTIRARMRQEGFISMPAVEDVIRMEAGAHRFHPIQDYLREAGLAYDGKQHIAFLAAHFVESTEPHKLFPFWLRRWLVGAAAKEFGDGYNEYAMLVLDGAQNLGKSHFAWWICSAMPDYFIENAIDTNEKDNLIRLIENWIWEVSELGATTRKSDVESLKAFITRRKVTVRRPWGKMDMVKPAMASLIGTVNNSAGILADQTGNRRFLISTIEEIDWNYATEIDPTQVWGEAYMSYMAGEDWRPTRDELKLAEENNDSFMFPDVLEGYLARHFIVDSQDTGSWMSTADVVAKLQNSGYRGRNTGGIAMRIASTFKKMRIRKEKRTVGHQRIWGYVGVKEKYPGVP